MDNLKSICKVCGEKTYDLFDAQFNIVYKRCSTCGFIHLNDDHHVSFDEERAEYDLHENSIEDEGYVNYLDRFLKTAVDPYVSEGKALDFGCGPEPVLAELLKRRGYDVRTFDRHFKHDADALEQKYNLITSTEVFEHFHDPVQEMKLISDLLAPGGVLAIMTSAPPEDGVFLKWSYRREQTHISFFTKKALEILAERNMMNMEFHDDKRITVFRKHTK